MIGRLIKHHHLRGCNSNRTYRVEASPFSSDSTFTSLSEASPPNRNAPKISLILVRISPVAAWVNRVKYSQILITAEKPDFEQNNDFHQMTKFQFSPYNLSTHLLYI